MSESTKSSIKSKSSRSSRRGRKRRAVDFETESVASSDLSGFEPTTQAQVPQEQPAPQNPFLLWKGLPDGKYNFLDGKWVKAPTPRNMFSIASKYEICNGVLCQWY